VGVDGAAASCAEDGPEGRAEDFTGGGFGCGNFAEGQDIGTAVAVDLDSAHGQEGFGRGGPVTDGSPTAMGIALLLER
jgi:hypothetical protein